LLSTARSALRLFFAVWPDAEMRARIAQSLSLLALPKGSSVAIENLHITLVFLGALDPRQQRLAEVVAKRVRMPVFDLVLDTFGYWARARVAWLGIKNVPPDLIRLEGDLRQGLQAAGLLVDPRPYNPHLTIIRNLRRIPKPLTVVPLAWSVRDFFLVASRSTASGVRYEVLRSWHGSSRREP
jgi:RNA 2',3'-cyclic 3'-phosphodiesterase